MAGAATAPNLMPQSTGFEPLLEALTTLHGVLGLAKEREKKEKEDLDKFVTTVTALLQVHTSEIETLKGELGTLKSEVATLKSQNIAGSSRGDARFTSKSPLECPKMPLGIGASIVVGVVAFIASRYFFG